MVNWKVYGLPEVHIYGLFGSVFFEGDPFWGRFKGAPKADETLWVKHRVPTLDTKYMKGMNGGFRPLVGFFLSSSFISHLIALAIQRPISEAASTNRVACRVFERVFRVKW